MQPRAHCERPQGPGSLDREPPVEEMTGAPMTLRSFSRRAEPHSGHSGLASKLLTKSSDCRSQSLHRYSYSGIDKPLLVLRDVWPVQKLVLCNEIYEDTSLPQSFPRSTSCSWFVAVGGSRLTPQLIHHMAIPRAIAMAPRNVKVQSPELMACLRIKSFRSCRVAAMTKLTATKTGIDQST